MNIGIQMGHQLSIMYRLFFLLLLLSIEYLFLIFPHSMSIRPFAIHLFTRTKYKVAKTLITVANIYIYHIQCVEDEMALDAIRCSSATNIRLISIEVSCRALKCTMII